MTAETTHFIQRSSTFQAINTVGHWLSGVGLDPFPLDAGQIIRKARKATGFQGPLPAQAEEGLRRLVEAILTEARPNPFARLAARNLQTRTLVGRLRVEQVLAERPEIEASPVRDPVFIIGMPRTGTTILHALLHEDPAHRSPLAWECLLPYPVPRPETFRDNTQLRAVRKEFAQLFKLVPDFQQKHYMAADSPQECISVHALDFNSFQPNAQYFIPSYMNWFANGSDQLATLRFHKRFLQYLQSGGVRSDRWLLKTPVHMMRLRELFSVYPDARIIMTHRHPEKIIPSITSLISSVRSLYSDHEDPLRTGQEQAGIWSRYVERFLAARASLGREDQIIDLRFGDFIADQVGTVRAIYDRFGWSLSAEAESRMRAFLRLNPKDKHGAHQYTLADFGLEEDLIRGQFQSYIDFLNRL